VKVINDMVAQQNLAKTSGKKEAVKAF
jgi:hypothetical protein